MTQPNLKDLVNPGDPVTVVFENATSITGTFESWRENYKYMVVSEPQGGPATSWHIINNFEYLTVT